MIIRVKLFGTLPDQFPGYNSAKGMEMEVPDGTSVKDLLARLDLPDRQGCFVSVDNTIAPPEQKLTHETTVLVLQSLAGG